MLIVCPACASAYEIEAAQVGPEGRAVRCAACRQTWFAGPASVHMGVPETAPAARETPVDDGDGSGPAAMPPDEAPPGPVLEAAPALEAPLPDRSMPPRRASRAAGPRGSKPIRPAARLPKPSPRVALGLVVFVALPLALLGRSTVVRAMPRSAGLFAAVGLPVNLRGADIRDVVAFRDPAEGGRPGRLVVEGDLVGVAAGRVSLAALEVEVRDAHDGPLMRWTAPAPRAALEPGETARFRASLPAPPVQGARVEVRFVREGGERRGQEPAEDTRASSPRDASPLSGAPAPHAPTPHAPGTHDSGH